MATTAAPPRARLPLGYDEALVANGRGFERGRGVAMTVAPPPAVRSGRGAAAGAERR